MLVLSSDTVDFVLAVFLLLLLLFILGQPCRPFVENSFPYLLLQLESKMPFTGMF